MVFKAVISDPKSRKAYQKEAEENASGLIGKKIGDRFSGAFLGLEGYELEITGGSDRQGFPMRPDVEGPARKRVVLAFPPGFHPIRKGERKRKSVRGNTVSKDISQINLRVVKVGKKALETLLGAKEKKPEEKAKPDGEREAPEGEKKGGAKKEKPKEEKRPAEAPKEGKPSEAPKEEAKKEGGPARKEEAKPKEEVKPEGKMGVKTLEEKEREVAKEEKRGPAEGKKHEKEKK